MNNARARLSEADDVRLEFYKQASKPFARFSKPYFQVAQPKKYRSSAYVFKTFKRFKKFFLCFVQLRKKHELAYIYVLTTV